MMDQHQKLRLKVTTNTGLNLMCTVNKNWTIEQLYPHITKLYKQVTEDQQSTLTDVYLTSLKHNSYFIPKSQLVGQIFEDGDQVNCNVQARKANKGTKDKKMVKKDKAGQKSEKKKENNSSQPQKTQIPSPSKNDKKQEKNKQPRKQKPKSLPKEQQNIQKNDKKQQKPIKRQENNRKQPAPQKKSEEPKPEPVNEQDKQKKNRKKAKKNKQAQDQQQKPRTRPQKSQLMKVFLSSQHKMEQKPQEIHAPAEQKPVVVLQQQQENE